MRDLHNSIRVLKAIPPQAVGTTGIANGSLSDVIDRQGYESVEFIVNHGSGGASVADVTTVILYESDSATAASFTSVANADLLGTEAAVGCPAENPRTSGVGKNKTGKLGYIGNKRYLRMRIYGTGTATSIVAAQAILSNPSRRPTA